MAAKKERKVVSGVEGHRDEETRIFQREEAYRLHTFEGWSLRQIAAHQGISLSVVQADVNFYRKMLREELPSTFEAWQMKLWQEYKTLLEEADAIIDEERSGFVRVQALKLKIDLTTKIENLFGITKGTKAPKPEEAVEDDVIVWSKG